MVEMIRVKLASGLYTKTSLWLDMRNKISHEEFDSIAEYLVYPEVRSDLKQRIQELPLAIKAYQEYQQTLREECLKAEAYELSGGKHYKLQEKKAVLDGLLLEELKKYPTVALEELKKFI